MALTLKLREEKGGLVVRFADQTVKTALEKIPAIASLQADPFTNGQVLTAALGGEEMLQRLANDADNLLLLDCDDTADAFAWEFATLADRQFLCVKAGMLRTVPRNAPPISGNGTLNFIALAADPLVDENGNPRDGYRLNLDNEMRSIRETLEKSGKNLTAKRIPPTRDALIDSLMEGSAILHLSCHGNVVPTKDGPMAVLALETEDGTLDPLLGGDLLSVAPRGALRFVLLSACYTATGTQANLARALALSGVPITVGMQNPFPDPLSDDLAVKLYRGLLAGLKIGEALRLTRVGLARHPASVGLPVGYVSANGWSEALPVSEGTPSVGGLGKPGEVALGGEIQPPRPLLGRNLELHQIAKLFSQGRKVITVAGTGGMGKTALASAFAERFAWLWSRGVRAYSFANEVNAANFRVALMRSLFGEEQAQQGAGLSEAQQREIILNAAREWNGLWLFDNYESVLDEKDKNADAKSIHRLIYDLANGGAALLLTSRNQPADLPNELLYPEGSHALHGLGDEAGVALFFQHSAKAKENAKVHKQFAFDIQRAAEGHPLAIALLAGEYDVSAVTMDAFLQGWQGELTNARRTGLAGHHVTFTTAFERSYSHLSADLQLALTCLSIFPFPFFAEGMAVVTGEVPLDDDEALPTTNHQLSTARQTLDELTRRSLLEVDGWYKDNTPATYRFQPALRQEAAHRLDFTLEETQQKGYAVYGAWLAKLGYAKFESDIPVNRLVRLSMDAMEKATETLQGAERLWHIRRLAWLKNAWGETRAAFDLLNSEISETLPNVETDPESAKVESSLRFELAGIYVTRGDLDRALSLYQENLNLYEQLGDKQGKAASLHQMAQVFLTRGDLDRALRLYEESLALKEQLGDKQGKAASLSNMAQVFVTRGDLDRALSLYEESLNLYEQLGDKQGAASTKRWLAVIAVHKGDLDKALEFYEETLITAKELGDIGGQSSSLHQMAQVFLTRGDLDRALSLYQESLALKEQLGDKKGKAASLHNMAQVFVTRGDLDRALSLYQESLNLYEQLGDKQGKAASLGQLANLYMDKKDYDSAEKVLLESLGLKKQIGHLEGAAFSYAKLGQVAAARGDKETALSHYREGLGIFEKLGAQPLVAQVKQMIAALEGGGVANDDPLAQAIAQARASAERGDVQSAIQYQEQAVALVREAGKEREALARLSVMLFNLAGYYAKLNRFDDAVKSMQEVVAIDEQTGHQDLESDRETLKTFEQIASMSPEERAQLQASQASTSANGAGEGDDFESQLQAQLAQLPPEQRPQAKAQIRKVYADFQNMSPEEQAAVVAGQRRAQIENAANQVRDAGVAYFRKQVPQHDVLQMLEDASKNMKDGESAGSPWLEVAALCDAIIALAKEEPAPPVPAAYVSHFSAVLSEKRKG